MDSFRMIVEQLKEMKGAIILMGSLVAFGFWVRPEVEKIAKPLRESAANLEEISNVLQRVEERIDSLSRWTEMRLVGNDKNLIRIEGRINTNRELINHMSDD